MFSLQLILNNLFFLEALMTALAYVSLRAYQTRRKIQLHLTKAADVKTPSHALIFLDYLAELITKSKNDPDDVVLTMIRQRHIMSCTLTSCYCNESNNKADFFVSLVKGEVR